MRGGNLAAKTAQCRFESEVPEFLRMKVVRDLMNMLRNPRDLQNEIFNLISRLIRIAQVLTKLRYLNRKKRQALSEVVMQLAREPGTFFFLRVKQPVAKIINGFRGKL